METIGRIEKLEMEPMETIGRIEKHEIFQATLLNYVFWPNFEVIGQCVKITAVSFFYRKY